MKITGLKPLELAPGVTALAVAEFDITLDFIISNSITDIEYQEGQSRVDKDTYYHFVGTGHTGGPFHVKKMTVLQKGKRFNFIGFFLEIWCQVYTFDNISESVAAYPTAWISFMGTFVAARCDLQDVLY